MAIFNPKHALDGIAAEALKVSDNIDLGSNKNLVNFFLFSTKEVVEPVVASIISAFAWKDSIHVRRMVSVCYAIIPQVVAHDFFRQVVPDSLLKACVQNLNDGYFQEVHSDVIALITQIYIKFRPVTDRPLQVFSTLPGMTPEKLRQFDETFTKEKAEKKHRLAMKTFLQDVTGVKVISSSHCVGRC